MTDKCILCGRKLYQRKNSSIPNKMCPNCQLIEHTQRKPHIGPNYKKDRKYIDDTEKVPKSSSRKAKKGSLMRSADMWFSRLVRVTHSIDVDGTLYCRDIITGNLYNIMNVDCGHYYSRRHMGTRYDLDNCRPQNRSSNRFMGEADKDIFRDHLIRQIGQQRFDSLDIKKDTITRMIDLEFINVIDWCKNELREISRTKKLPRRWMGGLK